MMIPSFNHAVVNWRLFKKTDEYKEYRDEHPHDWYWLLEAEAHDCEVVVVAGDHYGISAYLCTYEDYCADDDQGYKLRSIWIPVDCLHPLFAGVGN